MTTAHMHGGQPVLQAGAPLGDGAVVVMVHGRNAGPDNILSLVPKLDRPAVTYLAPAAAHRTWYPYTFLSERQKNEPHLSSALQVLAELAADLESRGIPPTRVFFLGFSQGACLSSEFVFRHPRRWGGLIALSGGLIGPPGTTWASDGSLEGTPVFFGCSDVDAHIPKERVTDSASVFSHMGARVTLRLYPGMDHIVNDDELEQARAVIDQFA
jgi:phospholipase/carboxylesterase/glyoxalase family protein